MSRDFAESADVYLSAPKLARRVLYIDAVAGFIPSLTLTFMEHKKEYNLQDEDMEPIVDWIFISLLNTVLQKNNARVLGHHRYDEAMTIASHVYPNITDLITKHFVKKYGHLKDTDVKVIVSGAEIIVAARLN